MFDFRRSAVFSLFAFVAACASQVDTERRWLDELGRTQRPASEDQRRVSELELQVRQLQAKLDVEEGRDRSRELHGVLERLDLLIAQNQQLVERAAVPNPPSPAPAITPAAEMVAAVDVSEDPKEQLRYWARRLREQGFRGGLTPEQRAALDVLLKRERSLDPKNPWQEL